MKSRASFFLLAENPGGKIAEETDFKKAGERILQTAGGLKNDSFLTRILSRPVSRQLTRFFVNTRFTPNHITWLSFALGMFAAAAFFFGGYAMGVAGAALLLVSIWVDGADGEVARIKFMESPGGGKLDIWCDNIVHVAVFFSIGAGLFHTTGQAHYLLLGSLAAAGSLAAFLMLRKTIIASKSPQQNTVQEKKETLVDKVSNRDFTHFLFLLALLDFLPVFLWMTAIGVNGLAVALPFSQKTRPSPRFSGNIRY